MKNPTIRRVALFIGVFLMLTLAEYAGRQRMAPFVNSIMTVQAGAGLINFITPSAGVSGRGDRIESSTTSIQVAQGCEGIDVILMLVAAIIAVPLGWRRKLAAGLIGTTVIYVLNLLRTAGLWYCLKYWPSGFEAMHIIVGQTVMIVVAVLILGFAMRGTRPALAGTLVP
jgi:exosortase/archaeosortase family protein